VPTVSTVSTVFTGAKKSRFFSQLRGAIRKSVAAVGGVLVAVGGVLAAVGGVLFHFYCFYGISMVYRT
jgi:hypothetical protein